MTRLTKHRSMQHFNSAGILLPGHLGLRPRSSGRAGGPCSGGPQMPRSWTAVRPAGTGNRRPSSALGCHRLSIAAVALSQAGRIPRGRLPFRLFPAEPQRPFLGPRGRGRELPEPFCVPLQTGLRASCFPCPQFTPFAPASSGLWKSNCHHYPSRDGLSRNFAYFTLVVHCMPIIGHNNFHFGFTIPLDNSTTR